jgi:hypothetical protein
MYPRVVISSLRERLEKSHFYHSLHLQSLQKVYYMSMSCFTIVSPTKASLEVLRFSQKMLLLHHVGPRQKYHAILHSIEQDTQPIVFLISKQVVPY